MNIELHINEPYILNSIIPTTSTCPAFMHVCSPSHLAHNMGLLEEHMNGAPLVRRHFVEANQLNSGEDIVFMVYRNLGH